MGFCCGGEEQEALKGQKEYKSKGYFLFLFFLFLTPKEQATLAVAVRGERYRGESVPPPARW